MKRIHKIIRSPWGARAVDGVMAARALLFVGRSYTCPCCGWSLRTFTRGGASLRAREKGYCPRCNAKPRHRWLWRHLRQHTDLFSRTGQVVLHVSPSFSIHRSLARLPHLKVFTGDLHYRSGVQFKMDLSASPFADDTFDVIICMHVLEHVEYDLPAIADLYRMLKPGGWSMIAVPIRPAPETLEDATITTPEDRRRVFGERDHWRFYGYDFADRLTAAGFQVTPYHANQLPPEEIQRFGLKDSEVMYYCTKG